ncbi:MAG: SDR family NAD(P)-dependent oxidoreductase [Herpetosiphonaceae bacterium]|nr:SDR family NAD(P)-dependent oxidoreductase [Herpetosiphonaceae bacterium]
MCFSDKVCLITGVDSGIGQATAERFAREGGKVVVVDIDPDHGTATVQAITKAGGQAILAKANVAAAADVQAAVKAAVDTWGNIDVVVNDAVMMTFGLGTTM